MVLRPDAATWEVDPFGNQVETPTSQRSEIPVDVVGWSAPSAQELATAGTLNRVAWDVDLYAPTGAVSHEDRVRLDDALFEVESVENYDNGPWWTPGLDVVHLRRVGG